MAILLQQERSRSNREVISVEEMSQGQGPYTGLLLPCPIFCIPQDLCISPKER